MHDGDAPARGGGNVDGVEPHAVPADDFQTLAGGHEAPGAARLGAEEQAVGVGGHAQEAGFGLVVAHDDARFGLEVRATGRVDGAGEDDEGTIGGHRDGLLVWIGRYLRATSTSRGVSSENGVPSRPP